MKKILLIGWILITLISCQNNEKGKIKESIKKEKVNNHNFDHKAYKMKGQILAKTTFKVFKSKIEEIGAQKGLPAVVDFCYNNAGKLTDSIGKSHNVIIKRTSHKLRNDRNAPTDIENMVIKHYLTLQNKNQNLEPIVKKSDDGYVHFYAPIKIKEKCLQCHGQKQTDIKNIILEKIKEKYPNDNATGFKIGDLRGIWHIKFLDVATK